MAAGNQSQFNSSSANNTCFSNNASCNPNTAVTASAHYNCDFELPFRYTICMLLGSTMLVASVSNILVCMAIASTKALRTKTNALLVNLSVSDIFISLALPFCEIIYVYSYPNWPLGRVGTYVLNSVWVFSLASPFVSLTIITIDRYMVITSKSISTGWRRRGSISAAVMLTWVYTIGIVILMALHFTWPGEDAYEWNILVEWYYPFLCVHIMIPMTVITILYVKIIRTARLSRNQASHYSSSTTNQTALTLREMRLAKTISIVIGLLVIVWLPVIVLEYFYAVESESCFVSKLGVVSVWITCVNGMINPMVYSLRNPQLRKAVRHLLRSVFCWPRECYSGRHMEDTSKGPTSLTTSSFQVSGVVTPWRKQKLYTGRDGLESSETIDSVL